MDPCSLVEAMTIFTTIHYFIRDRANNRHNPDLDSLPEGFEAVPWRQVYRKTEQQSLIPPMVHWEPSELSFGGGGHLWCFTGLCRCGRNIIRKTDDGQAWESRNGRQRKNGYPAQILVDRLVLSSSDGQRRSAFDMLELTLDQTRPSVALCKIRRTQQGTNVASGSSQQDSNNVNAFSPGLSTSQEVLIRLACKCEISTSTPAPLGSHHLFKLIHVIWICLDQLAHSNIRRNYRCLQLHGM